MSQEHDRTPDLREHQADLQLVEAILAGSEIAWHTFIDRYARLISHVARRYLFDEDDVAGVLADVLVSLHKGKFKAYRGRSSLSTWLIIVSRNAAADALRRMFGRQQLPRGLRDLDRVHHEVFRIYYVEGSTFAATLKEMQIQEPAFDRDLLLAALQTIDDRVSDQTLRRISYDLAAQSVGAASGRLLEYCEAVRNEAHERAVVENPLDRLVRREAEAQAAEVLKLVAALPDEEREILSLRFDKGLRAKEIAAELGYPGQRKVFTVLDRVMRRLRRLQVGDRNEDDVRIEKID